MDEGEIKRDQVELGPLGSAPDLRAPSLHFPFAGWQDKQVKACFKDDGILIALKTAWNMGETWYFLVATA